MFKCYTWDRPLVDHPAFRQTVRPPWAGIINDVYRWVASGLAAYHGDDPLDTIWILPNAGEPVVAAGAPFVVDDPEYWGPYAWIGTVLEAIEKLAGGQPKGIVFDHEATWPKNPDGSPRHHHESKEAREALLNDVFYAPIKTWSPDIITGNFGGHHTLGNADQPALYRPYDVSFTLGELGEMGKGDRCIPWIHLVGNLQRGWPTRVSPAQFILPIVLAHATNGSTEFILWNSNKPYPKDPSMLDRTADWERAADMLPRLGFASPRTDFEKLLEKLSQGEKFNFDAMLQVLSEWGQIQE